MKIEIEATPGDRTWHTKINGEHRPELCGASLESAMNKILEALLEKEAAS